MSVLQEVLAYLGQDGDSASVRDYSVFQDRVLDDRTAEVLTNTYEESHNLLRKIPVKNLGIQIDDKIFVYIEDLRYYVYKKLQRNPEYRKYVRKRLEIFSDKDRERIKRLLWKAKSPEIKKQENELKEYMSTKEIRNTMKKFDKKRYSDVLSLPDSSQVTRPRFLRYDGNFDDVLKKPFYMDMDDAFKLFSDLWHREEYGPIPATMIYLGYTIDKIPMRALQRAWVEMRKSILSQKEKNLGEIYQNLSGNFDYTYCTDQYNFLFDFYNKGICNCECGSYLVMQISKVLKPPSQTIFAISESHAKIISNYQEVPHILETTDVKTLYHPLVYLADEGIFYSIFSEQLLALHIFIISVRSSELGERTYFYRTVAKMIGLDTSLSLKEALRSCDRRSVKTLLDSNSFDILVTILFSVLTGANVPYNFCYELNKKYISLDIWDALSPSNKPTEKELRERMLQFTEELGKEFESFNKRDKM